MVATTVSTEDSRETAIISEAVEVVEVMASVGSGPVVKAAEEIGGIKIK